jgi:hypothetical protein
LELFSSFLCCLCFSMLFCCPAHCVVIPDVHLLFLSSEYSLSFITWLFLFMESKRWMLLICHLAPSLSKNF